MVLLVVHTVAVAALAGLSWVVQVVVYPAFLVVGPTQLWSRFHADHSRRVTRVVVVPWAVQGATLALLLLDRPAGVPLPLVLTAAGLGLLTVAATALGAVPLHRSLGTYDERRAQRLLAVHRVRTAAWTAGTACAAAMLLVADR